MAIFVARVCDINNCVFDAIKFILFEYLIQFEYHKHQNASVSASYEYYGTFVPHRWYLRERSTFFCWS